jgi:transposase
MMIGGEETSVRRRSITKAGDVLARRVLIEGARTPAGAGFTACRHA